MSTALMAPRKKRNTKSAAITQAISEQYQPQTASVKHFFTLLGKKEVFYIL